MQESIEDKRGRTKRIFTAPKVGIAGALIALAIATTGALSFSLFANRAQGRPMDMKNEKKSAGKGKAASPPTPAKKTGSQEDVVSENAGSRRSLDFYTKGVRGTLFSAPQPAPTPKPKVVVVKPLPPPPKIFIPEVKPVEINPFADWSYTGTVTIGETKMALIENSKTKEGRYLKQGEEFQGAKVTQVTDQMVSMSAGMKPYLLAKSDNINIVPLDKSAPYLNGGAPAPGQPVPPPPGGAPPVSLTATIDSGATVTLPNGAVLKGGRATRYNTRMNRKFK